jgi:hypothetical protein
MIIITMLKLILGQQQGDEFITNISEERFKEIIKYFSKCRHYHYQNKWYFYDDLKYIITMSTGYHKCVKNHLTRYSLNDNVMACNVYETNIPLHHFPCSTMYHDTRLVEQTDYRIDSNCHVELQTITHSDNTITRECVIVCKKDVPKIVSNFVSWKTPNIDINTTLIL